MKLVPPLRPLWFFLTLFLLSSLTGILLAQETLRIQVRRGDSLSYLSFKTYGMYNREIADILKRENPQIKEIDLIFAGQFLNFPTPESLKKKLAERSAKPLSPAGTQEVQEGRPSPPVVPTPGPLSETQVRAQNGVITFLEGGVQVKKSGETQWVSARPNMILSEKDQIRVPPQAKAELILDNQSVLRLSGNTVLTLQKLEEEKATRKENTRVEMSLGRLWLKMGKLFNPASRCDVRTPTVIAGVQGTIYQLSVAGDQSTTIQVYEGAVRVYNPFPQAQPPDAGGPTQVEKPREVAGPKEVGGPKPVSREIGRASCRERV